MVTLGAASVPRQPVDKSFCNGFHAGTYSACGMDAVEPWSRMDRALLRILYVLAAGGTNGGSLAGGSVVDSARRRSQRSAAASHWAASWRNRTA